MEGCFEEPVAVREAIFKYQHLPWVPDRGSGRGVLDTWTPRETLPGRRRKTTLANGCQDLSHALLRPHGTSPLGVAQEGRAEGARHTPGPSPAAAADYLGKRPPSLKRTTGTCWGPLLPGPCPAAGPGSPLQGVRLSLKKSNTQHERFSVMPPRFFCVNSKGKWLVASTD